MEKKIMASLFERVENEDYARKLGIQLIALDQGRAIVEMEPKEDNLNIFDMTHGGAIFSLIDEAFQVSCNSYGTVAVALNMMVTFHKSPDIRSRLRAESREIHRSRKTATYEIKVTDEKNAPIASCQAMAYLKRDKLPFLENVEEHAKF